MNELTAAIRTEIVAIGLTPVALVTLLGFLFKEKWKQMLARTLALDLEQEKGKALREIEAYKVSLIADAERSKAVVELKKLIAVKHTTDEYEALVALYGLLMTATTAVCTRAIHLPDYRLDGEDRMREIRASSDARERLDQAFERALLFLSPQTANDCFTLTMKLLEIEHFHLIVDNAAPLTDEAKNEMVRLGGHIRVAVKARIDELVRIAARGDDASEAVVPVRQP